MHKDDIISLAAAVGLPLIGGAIGGLVSAKDVVGGWYTRIKKPKWTPPNWLFGGVWPLLYIGQGISSWLVFKTKGAKKRLPLSLYAAQLVLNLAWQPIFFKGHRPDIALADSAACLGLATAATVTMTQAAGKVQDRGKVVAGLMSPYVAWLAFATTLTYNIWKNNPDAAKADSPEGPTPAGQQGVFKAIETATKKA